MFVSVCVSRYVCVYVCQHEYFRGPTLSGGDRASPERGHTALQGGDWKGWLDGEKERDREEKKSKISRRVWTQRRFANRKTGGPNTQNFT